MTLRETLDAELATFGLRWIDDCSPLSKKKIKQLRRGAPILVSRLAENEYNLTVRIEAVSHGYRLSLGSHASIHITFFKNSRDAAKKAANEHILQKLERIVRETDRALGVV